MSIKVVGGSASLTTEIPVFIGTTGGRRATLDYKCFPDVGHPLFDFVFEPAPDDSGTLVFDHADPAKRTPTSPCFYHYFWNKDKLRVEEGLGKNTRRYLVWPRTGYLIEGPRGFKGFDYGPRYITGEPIPRPEECAPCYYRISILEFARYIEGKIDLETLHNGAEKI